MDRIDEAYMEYLAEIERENTEYFAEIMEEEHEIQMQEMR